jgi:hypothetical protein
MLRMYAFAAVIVGCGSACTPAKRQSGPQQQQEEKHTGVISGTVVNQRGEPMADVTASVHPGGRPFMGIVPSDQTDPEGKFWFGRLTWGKYVVCARKEADGYREICDSVFTKDSGPNVTLSPLAPIATVQVTIGPKAGTLTGTITDAMTGVPVNPISDAITGARPAPVLRVRPLTDNGRNFDQTVGPQFTTLIPPNADLELEVREPGYQLWRFSVHGGRRGKPFRIKSGEKRALHIQLRPELR